MEGDKHPLVRYAHNVDAYHLPSTLRHNQYPTHTHIITLKFYLTLSLILMNFTAVLHNLFYDGSVIMVSCKNNRYHLVIIFHVICFSGL